ncbi:hypothetical protein D3C72_1708530 [compost metagenome]
MESCSQGVNLGRVVQIEDARYLLGLDPHDTRNVCWPCVFLDPQIEQLHLCPYRKGEGNKLLPGFGCRWIGYSSPILEIEVHGGH